MPDDRDVEIQALRAEVESLRTQRAAEKGPAQGTKICFRRVDEAFCRPGQVLSEGFTEHVQVGPAMTNSHALIEYGEPRTDGKDAPLHTFHTDRPYNPSGAPDTWHLPDECPLHKGKGCPYADGA